MLNWNSTANTDEKFDALYNLTSDVYRQQQEQINTLTNTLMMFASFAYAAMQNNTQQMNSYAQQQPPLMQNPFQFLTQMYGGYQSGIMPRTFPQMPFNMQGAYLNPSLNQLMVPPTSPTGSPQALWNFNSDPQNLLALAALSLLATSPAYRNNNSVAQALVSHHQQPQTPVMGTIASNTLNHAREMSPDDWLVNRIMERTVTPPTVSAQTTSAINPTTQPLTSPPVTYNAPTQPSNTSPTVPAINTSSPQMQSTAPLTTNTVVNNPQSPVVGNATGRQSKRLFMKPGNWAYNLYQSHKARKARSERKEARTQARYRMSSKEHRKVILQKAELIKLRRERDQTDSSNEKAKLSSKIIKLENKLKEQRNANLFRGPAQITIPHSRGTANSLNEQAITDLKAERQTFNKLRQSTNAHVTHIANKRLKAVNKKLHSARYIPTRIQRGRGLQLSNKSRRRRRFADHNSRTTVVQLKEANNPNWNGGNLASEITHVDGQIDQQQGQYDQYGQQQYDENNQAWQPSMTVEQLYKQEINAKRARFEKYLQDLNSSDSAKQQAAKTQGVALHQQLTYLYGVDPVLGNKLDHNDVDQINKETYLSRHASSADHARLKYLYGIEPHTGNWLDFNDETYQAKRNAYLQSPPAQAERDRLQRGFNQAEERSRANNVSDEAYQKAMEKMDANANKLHLLYGVNPFEDTTIANQQLGTIDDVHRLHQYSQSVSTAVEHDAYIPATGLGTMSGVDNMVLQPPGSFDEDDHIMDDYHETVGGPQTENMNQMLDEHAKITSDWAQGSISQDTDDPTLIDREQWNNMVSEDFDELARLARKSTSHSNTSTLSAYLRGHEATGTDLYRLEQIKEQFKQERLNATKEKLEQNMSDHRRNDSRTSLNG